MICRGPLKTVLAGLVAVLLSQPNLVCACAACYGQSDSPMARGMNWGIFSLMGVVAGVLGSFAAFFVYLAKRSAATDPSPTAPSATAPAQPLTNDH